MRWRRGWQWDGKKRRAPQDANARSSKAPFLRRHFREKKLIDRKAESRNDVLTCQFPARIDNVGRTPIGPMDNRTLVVSINKPDELNSRANELYRSMQNFSREVIGAKELYYECWFLPCRCCLIHLDSVPSSEFPSRQRDRPMDDHFLAERRRHNIVTVGEGLEHSVGHFTPQRFKQQRLAHQGNAAADNDPARTQQDDDAANGVR